MNYTEIMDAIKNASLFDLYRLKVAIGNELENSERLDKIKAAINIGDVLFYFGHKDNKLEQVKVIQKNIKYAIVEKIEDGKRWRIAYYLFNLGNVDTEIHTNNVKLSKNTLKVGDFVGFNNNSTTIAGMIIKLNRTRVKLVTPSNQRWNVYYEHLFRIIDVDIINQFDPCLLNKLG